MLSGPYLAPSASLPPLRFLTSTTEEQIYTALQNLQTLYCPLRLPASPKATTKRKPIQEVSTPVLVDSGYASQDEEENDESAASEAIEALRADPFERNFATRWLTSLLSRSWELVSLSEETQSRIIDDAASILASFSDPSTEEEEQALTRAFAFSNPATKTPVNITLNDAPLSGTDHTDVGLQSWGASIILSDLLCSVPSRFSLSSLPATPTIIELGAGTGLVSLTLAKLLPSLDIHPAAITATDYHPTVLSNLHKNITTNFPDSSTAAPVQAALLDWSLPPPALARTADFLVASDVVYAPQHASWLRDCTAHLLAPGGVFWLMVTVRKNGKFEGIPETVEDAFVQDKCPKDKEGRVFTVLGRETFEKRKGIGRGDEAGYRLYRIGWAVGDLQG